MTYKSIIQEAKDIQMAMELITLGARLQMLECETQISRPKLIKLYKELRGSPPPKGMLPFSTDWYMIWEQNIHSSMFYNIFRALKKNGESSDIAIIIQAYHLYLEQCPPQVDELPLLTMTRAWTLVRFVNSGMLQLTPCSHCQGHFVTYAHHPVYGFVCSLCQPPSRAIKRRKIIPESEMPAITPQYAY
ncbi:flagellar transcriptional regulator FlhC [Sodalis sp. C49]|uniref:flagellar transcriptional regulator FlhC n=1 Tax=unclassified Sodalis (in: enterobacteria) TaxID=2636512 RepID=UPI003965BD33